MKIIVDNGTYGLGNIGDIAMLQVAVLRLRHLFPNALIQVLTSEPERLLSLCPEARAQELGKQTALLGQGIGPAYQRRGLALPTTVSNDVEPQHSVDEFHRTWAWWALGAGNVATARKHALLAVGKKLTSIQSWKVLACAVRGY